MMTNRVLVSAIAVTLLCSLQMQAMHTAVGFLRFAAQHKQLTAGTIAALSLGVYAYKKGCWPFGRKQVATTPTTGLQQSDLGNSFVQINNVPLSYSQNNALANAHCQELPTTTQKVLHAANVAGKALANGTTTAVTTASPYVQQGYTAAKPYGNSAWEALKNGAYNAWNSGTVATVTEQAQQGLSAAATGIKQQGPTLVSKAAQNTAYGLVCGAKLAGSWVKWPFGRRAQQQTVVPAVPTLLPVATITASTNATAQQELIDEFYKTANE